MQMIELCRKEVARAIWSVRAQSPRATVGTVCFLCTWIYWWLNLLGNVVWFDALSAREREKEGAYVLFLYVVDLNMYIRYSS